MDDKPYMSPHQMETTQDVREDVVAARYARLPLYIALVAAALQVVLERASGRRYYYDWGCWCGWSGEAHFWLSCLFYGTVGWFCVIVTISCCKSALSIYTKMACAVLLIPSAMIGIGFAVCSLGHQQTSAHYQGPEHRLAMDVGLTVLVIFAIVGYAVHWSGQRRTNR